MTSTDFFYLLGDLFQWTFGVFEFIGNWVNLIFLIGGFAGFYYWMSIQKKFNDLSNIPVEIKDNEGWYNKSPKNNQLK
ncbi:MAG: hypothetical protein QNL43_01590 [Crocinitomicaceae bacterium]|jgi:hypothetical protein|tara:strand:+ start:9107 stop:9340 length:234 start_codon:yes stop_codon:yes gene_type:complete